MISDRYASACDQISIQTIHIVFERYEYSTLINYSQRPVALNGKLTREHIPGQQNAPGYGTNLEQRSFSVIMWKIVPMSTSHPVRIPSDANYKRTRDGSVHYSKPSEDDPLERTKSGVLLEPASPRRSQFLIRNGRPARAHPWAALNDPRTTVPLP